LKNNGIASDVYYPCPIHLTEPCNQLNYRPGEFPVAEKTSRNSLCIPLYPELDEQQMAYIINKIQLIHENMEEAPV
jgi:dTDP-4-amino-4,6-dideoxygalactose transaminase